MNEGYKMIKKLGKASFIERKSRFISYTKPVYTEEEALKFLAEIKKKHYDARHNCYAYIIGENSSIQRSSDDGEPSGTAGIPILEIIKKEGLTNTIIIVTRYFGGILLGAGGLIRAYAEGASRAISTSGIQEVRPFSEFVIETDYTNLGKIQHEALQNNYIVNKIDYTENVKITMYIPVNKENVFKHHINEWTSGTATISYMDKKMLKVDV